MSANHGQFCPAAKAMELLDERWTLLVVRELMRGCAAGWPHISGHVAHDGRSPRP